MQHQSFVQPYSTSAWVNADSAASSDRSRPVLAKDRRQSPRFPTLGYVALLEASGDNGLCRIQDISNEGAKIKTPIVLRCGDPLKLSLDCENKLRARVVWVAGDKAGILFIQPIDAASVIGRLAKRTASGMARGPRVTINRVARVTAGLKCFPTVIGNISQKGMNICHSGGLFPGTAVTISVEGSFTSRGTVRWSNAMFAGIELSSMIPADRLASAKLV